ncbi:MAG TPA: AAA family ATPase [Streptosporangiaceae bacterium]|nr:AAA family ATPase [Streptosporangiaceae bacterium]
MLTVLIWLNGPHGVGKTQVAFDLHRRLPGSVVCDPEHLVDGLRRMLPEKELRTDLRGVPLWRYGVRDVLCTVLPVAAGPVISPMTVSDPDGLAEIIGPLRAAGHAVYHVTLLASRDVLLRRRRSRLETTRGCAARQLDRVLDALLAPEFARHLSTDGMPIGAVADDIACHAGLKLEPDCDGLVRRRIRRIGVQLDHIRWG